MLQFFKGKGNDCDYCIHLCVLVIKRELQTWTQVCVFKHADKAWCEAKKRHFSVVGKTVDHTQAEEQSLRSNPERRETFCKGCQRFQ